MTYFDNSATTKINEEVLKIVSNDLFTKVTEEELGPYKDEIKKLLNTDLDVIITSGSTESNNLVLKGLNFSKKEIITTHLEHSSINESLKYLEENGYVIKYIPVKDGVLDLEKLEDMISDNTLLISVCLVNSETGILNDINKIGKIAHKHGVFFHTDITQGIGKIPISLSMVDFASFSSHKFHGPKGIGVLLKNKDISLKSLIYGERTYNLGLIRGMVKALDVSLKEMNYNYDKVKSLRDYFINCLEGIPNVLINEGFDNIPHILNISVLDYKPETFLHYLEMFDIYISTKSACSSGNYSEAVLDLTHDINRALTSVRFSLSEDIDKKDIDKVIELIKRGSHGR